MLSRMEAIATATDLPERLSAALAARGGNRRDGREFAPELSYGRHFGPAPPTARSAAVVALLFCRDGRWHVPLTVRHAALGKHGGQISLPGGSVDPGETSASAARRELAEELGTARSVDLVGQLRECYVYVSDFRVTPWLAVTRDEPTWQPHDREVERVVELPIETLLDPGCRGTMTIERGPLVFRAPCFRLGEDCVWGATSIILGELAGVLQSNSQRNGQFMTDSPHLAAVVFDLDGLIVNSEDVYEQADVEVLRRRGKTYNDDLRSQMMGRPTAESLRKMIDWHALEDSVELLDAERSQLRDTLLAASLAPMPGLLDLLAALEAVRIPKAIATSGHRSYAVDVLGRLDLYTRFEFVLTAEDVVHGKPAPDVYRLAAQRLSLAPSQTMVLEDSENGCRAGVAAGAFTVAVPNRHTRDHDFAGVEFVAETLADPRIRHALAVHD